MQSTNSQNLWFMKSAKFCPSYHDTSKLHQHRQSVDVNFEVLVRSGRETKVGYPTGGNTTCGTQKLSQNVAPETLWRCKFGFWSILSVFAPVRAHFTGGGGERQRRARKRMIQFFSRCPRVSNRVNQFSKSLVHENRQILSQLRADSPPTQAVCRCQF